MNWLRWPARRGRPLEPGQRAALQAYRSREAPDLGLPWAAARIVVVDVETSGLNPYSDSLLSIGAVAVNGGLVRLDQGFETVLRQEQPSDHGNILVHGIGGSDQLAGREPARALLDFLNFAGKDPLVGFNADFDRIAIERATRRALGIKPANTWLDLAVLLPALFPRRVAGARTLDDWARMFGIDNPARHNAVFDALATAQLLLVALAAASAKNVKTWAELIGLQRAQRWFGGRH
jgi:DNA polymerase III subunit epsilon